MDLVDNVPWWERLRSRPLKSQMVASDDMLNTEAKLRTYYGVANRNPTRRVAADAVVERLYTPGSTPGGRAVSPDPSLKPRWNVTGTHTPMALAAETKRSPVGAVDTDAMLRRLYTPGSTPGGRIRDEGSADKACETYYGMAVERTTGRSHGQEVCVWMMGLGGSGSRGSRDLGFKGYGDRAHNWSKQRARGGLHACCIYVVCLLERMLQ